MLRLAISWRRSKWAEMWKTTCVTCWFWCLQRFLVCRFGGKSRLLIWSMCWRLYHAPQRHKTSHLADGCSKNHKRLLKSNSDHPVRLGWSRTARWLPPCRNRIHARNSHHWISLYSEDTSHSTHHFASNKQAACRRKHSYSRVQHRWNEHSVWAR